jgi:hypothetical protein
MAADPTNKAGGVSSNESSNQNNEPRCICGHAWETHYVRDEGAPGACGLCSTCHVWRPVIATFVVGQTAIQRDPSRELWRLVEAKVCDCECRGKPVCCDVCDWLISAVEEAEGKQCSALTYRRGVAQRCSKLAGHSDAHEYVAVTTEGASNA